MCIIEYFLLILGYWNSAVPNSSLHYISLTAAYLSIAFQNLKSDKACKENNFTRQMMTLEMID